MANLAARCVRQGCSASPSRRRAARPAPRAVAGEGTALQRHLALTTACIGSDARPVGRPKRWVVPTTTTRGNPCGGGVWLVSLSANPRRRSCAGR